MSTIFDEDDEIEAEDCSSSEWNKYDWMLILLFGSLLSALFFIDHICRAIESIPSLFN